MVERYGYHKPDSMLLRLVNAVPLDPSRASRAGTRQPCDPSDPCVDKFFVSFVLAELRG